MKSRITISTIILLFIISFPAKAGGQDEIQKYYNNVAKEVKAANSPAEKREILNNSFTKMSQALKTVQSLPFISEKDRTGIEVLKVKIQEKQDELAGRNGFVRVPDTQLNSFSDYVVQDSEQAVTITISILALVLIAILILILI